LILGLLTIYVRVDNSTKSIYISKVLDGYEQMFIDEAGSIRTYIDKHRFVTLPKGNMIQYIAYDWTRNEMKN
jgi:hypothetical protein